MRTSSIIFATTTFFSVLSLNALAQKRDLPSDNKGVHITIDASRPAGLIDPLIYGQLFEHIYFSANNGVWQEMIYGRSFEPEQYPGIPPRDGYFDGWYEDETGVLHSPTRYEQPINITNVKTDEYEITMDVNWRAYKLARRSWSGGLMDIRIAFGQNQSGKPYYFRIHNPYYESSARFTPAQTESQIEANREAEAKARATQIENSANFSVSTMEEREVQGFGGRTRKVNTLTPLAQIAATDSQIDESSTWHKLRLSRKRNEVTAFWDDKQLLQTQIDENKENNVTIWVNYTEALFRNIKVTGPNGKKVFFEGTPDSTKVPSVGPHWEIWGKGAKYQLVKGDAVNMDYSQMISSRKLAGISHGPQYIHNGEVFVGSLYAKGKGKVTVALVNGDRVICSQKLGKPGKKKWKKMSFRLDPNVSPTDAQFAILVEKGSVLVDQVSMSSEEGLALGGFRPDIFKSVKELHPTCLRWPGGGYAAQYNWKWAIGPQENRQRWPHWMWMDYDQNVFGTDEFISFCKKIDSEPVIVVSVGFDRPESEQDSILKSAADWVAYCNEPATGRWGKIRAANGHPEPYNVKFWEIDNEMWEMGYEKYSKAVVEFSTAMKKIDPSIKIIVCGGFQEDQQFIKDYGHLFDYMSLHHYEQAGGFETGPARLKQQYDRYAEYIAACANPNIKLFISEWNLNSIDWRTGLFAGGFLNMCENTPVVAMGAAALFIRRTDAPDWNNAFINFDYKDMFVAPNYQVTKLWQENFSQYRLDYTGDPGPLSISTTMSEDEKDIIIKIVNATEEKVPLVIDGNWEGFHRLQTKTYAPRTLNAANSMEKKDAVILNGGSGSSSNMLKSANVEVQPLSAMIIRIDRNMTSKQ